MKSQWPLEEGNRRTGVRERGSKDGIRAWMKPLDGATSQGHKQPLEARRGKATDSALKPPDGLQVANTPVVASCHPFPISDLQSCETVNVCCFKPLCVCSFVTAAIGDEHTDSSHVIRKTEAFLAGSFLDSPCVSSQRGVVWKLQGWCRISSQRHALKQTAQRSWESHTAQWKREWERKLCISQLWGPGLNLRESGFRSRS